MGGSISGTCHAHSIIAWRKCILRLGQYDKENRNPVQSRRLLNAFSIVIRVFDTG
jgi:hypothetical protein